ncbi:MAG: hypothetical protein VYB61_11000 [Verrucomicrobiota bacterium]|nr:hypothetical protein [Verrucomicrobiota bacterium]
MPGDKLNNNNANPALCWLLRILCAVMFAGHGWMCFNEQMPLHALLQDEPLMATFVKNFFSMDWKDWLALKISDHIDTAIRVQAWIFFVFAALTLVPARNWFMRIVYLTGTANLVFLAWLKYFDAAEGIGHFLEHAGQFCMPLMVYLVVFGRGWRFSAGLIAAIAIALAFVCHGLLAIGLPSEISWLNHPRPGKFTEMTMLSLGLESEKSAGAILLAAGILDIAAAIFLFTAGKWRTMALVYMLIWGLLTTLARPWSYFDPVFAGETLNRWLPEALYRVPHFGLPLCLLLALRRRNTNV